MYTGNNQKKTIQRGKRNIWHEITVHLEITSLQPNLFKFVSDLSALKLSTQQFQPLHHNSEAIH